MNKINNVFKMVVVFEARVKPYSINLSPQTQSATAVLVIICRYIKVLVKGIKEGNE